MIVLQILLIAVLFTLVVGIHELGHYFFAKWKGMVVEEFSIGFGPKVWSRVSKGGTAFSLRGVPLGGFVRIRGMEPKADASETRIEGGFYQKSIGSRALVLFAGPLFSLLGGYLLFATAFAGWGEPKVREEAIVGGVEETMAAYKAGLREGDRVIRVDGKSVSNFVDLRAVVASSPGKPLKFLVERDAQKVELTITPALNKNSIVVGADGKPVVGADGQVLRRDQGQIGIVPDVYMVPVSIGRSLQLAGLESWAIISETGKVLASPSQLKENAGGVISIARATSRAAHEGLLYFLRLAAIISISLGLINLLPIPLMDGGQLVVAFVEWLRGGRRLSLRTQEAIGLAGLLIIGLLFLSVTYLDIGRLLKN